MEESPSYLLEFTRIGGQVKVTACDPESGVEATVIVPATSSQRDMAQLAIRKLHYVLSKKAKL